MILIDASPSPHTHLYSCWWPGWDCIVLEFWLAPDQFSLVRDIFGTCEWTRPTFKQKLVDKNITVAGWTGCSGAGMISKN